MERAKAEPFLLLHFFVKNPLERLRIPVLRMSRDWQESRTSDSVYSARLSSNLLRASFPKSSRTFCHFGGRPEEGDLERASVFTSPFWKMRDRMRAV